MLLICAQLSLNYVFKTRYSNITIIDLLTSTHPYYDHLVNCSHALVI